MLRHAYWKGQIRISLVALTVEVVPATKRSSQLPLHELHRPTGERIHHQNVLESGKPVQDRDPKANMCCSSRTKSTRSSCPRATNWNSRTSSMLTHCRSCV